ncbi:MAG: hypothetical protein ACO3E3_04365 [Candidatus Limnocylindrus sp.]
MPEKKEAAADEAGIEERIRALDRMTTGSWPTSTSDSTAASAARGIAPT